ncbi:carboxymuconolactone decarboxylase family protein [Rudaeicoccus suwonensis]|uniref:4-carboxymuconolactone decarboxylase n=1 Tax=Rudaeicoccus suwonensis TaxID=657409 RepID=A0A561EAP3_9MICO|nr:carboxymuconolactone decarboxylase family protein [Rudaeicoccus suwonensis]TWE12678.1 4-carboxymuconolactone decarboxylase [Rudaeicoccus suwonensis]
MTDHDTPQATGWTGGQRAFGDFAPGLVHYTDKVLFDQVWERKGLSKRDRGLITVAALVATGKTEQLTFHLDYARTNGATEDELKEAILHLAFYTGWPNGMSAMTVAKNIFDTKETA